MVNCEAVLIRRASGAHVLAKAADQFRASDVTLWGIVALSAWVVAILGANLSGLVPPNVYAAMHASRLEGTTLNQLRNQVATLQDDIARSRRETTEVLQRLALHEDSTGAVAKRIGALEVSVPKLIEETQRRIPAGIDTMPTASIGVGRTVTFEAEGGTVAVQQRPLTPGSDEVKLTAVPLAVDMPAKLDPLAQGVALGFPVVPDTAEAQWQEMLASVGPLLIGLSPVLGRNDQGLRQIVAGPIIDRASALELCGRLDAVGIPCEPVAYSGDPMPLLN